MKSIVSLLVLISASTFRLFAQQYDEDFLNHYAKYTKGVFSPHNVTIVTAVGDRIDIWPNETLRQVRYPLEYSSFESYKCFLDSLLNNPGSIKLGVGEGITIRNLERKLKAINRNPDKLISRLLVTDIGMDGELVYRFKGGSFIKNKKEHYLLCKWFFDHGYYVMQGSFLTTCWFVKFSELEPLQDNMSLLFD